MDDSYKKELVIDKYHLDDEAAQQPMRFVKWAEKYAEYEKALRDLEQQLNKRKGVVDIQVRNNPSKYDLGDEPKETAIKYAVLADKEVEKLEKEYSELKKDLSILQAVKMSFEGRKTMIRILGELWLGEYYSDLEVRAERAKNVRRKLKQSRLGSNSNDKRRLIRRE